MKILQKALSFFLLLISFSFAFAQDEYQAKYLLGKDLLKQGRYTAAMEVLKPLTQETEGNKYVQYAHYFYSMSAFKAGLFQDANIMLLHLKDRYSSWEKMEEAYYLLANVAFEQKKYRIAISYLEGRKKEFKESIEGLKNNYYAKINPIDTLIILQRDYPTDQIMAKVLAKRLSTSTTNERQKMLLEYLIQEYKLERQKLVSGKESIKKPAYNVAVLFPFMLKEFNSSTSARSNQFVYDIYDGIRLAVDSLKKDGVKINLFVYDTEKDDSKLSDLLKLPELKTMDMILGPLYPTLYAAVNEFGLKNKILIINPFSNNTGLLENTNFTYLFQPTLQSLSGQAAKFASENFVKDASVKKVIIFQSPTSKDSLIADNFKDSIIAAGFEVDFHEVINKENIQRVQQVLKDSVMLTKVSHIFISSSDQVLAANIISSMEISGFKIPLITGDEWLQFTLISYEQFERRDVHFVSTDYLDYSNPSVLNYRKAFFSRTNMLPSSYSYQGYELMYLFGSAAGKYGNYFVAGLRSQGFVPGQIFQGVNYSAGNSNGYVPIVKFVDFQLTVLNNPLYPLIMEKKKGK